MKKQLWGLFCAAVLAATLALPVRAAEQTHRAYLCGYPDGTIRPNARITRAQLACALVRLAEEPLPEPTRVTFFDVPGDHWACTQIRQLAGLGLLPFGEGGFPALTAAWEEKTVLEAGQGSAAGSASVSRAEFARACNSLLGRSPDGKDAQLRAAAWYWDNQDETAWYYADLIEAAVDHTCRVPNTSEQWTAVG